MQKAFDYMEKHHMIEAYDKVIVGVSGGADSLCLLFVLQEYSRRLPFTVEAAHIEHGIRGQESLEDARFVEELCGAEQIPFHLVRCDVPDFAKKNGMSLEEAARAVRYEALERIRREAGADRIAVAHNQSDQAETMLFSMARGSGLLGAGGIRPVRGNIIRPLLACSRGEIEAYLTERGIRWRTDCTNADMIYARNCIRHRVLPVLREQVNAACDAHFAALAEELQTAQAYMEQQAKQRADAVSSREGGEIRISVPLFCREPEALQGSILRICLQRAGCGLRDVGRQHMENMRGLFFGQSGRRLSLPGGFWAERRFDAVFLCGGEAAPKTAREMETAQGIVPETAREMETAQGIAQESAPKAAQEAETVREMVQETVQAAQEIEAPGTYPMADGSLDVRVFPYKNENILQKRYTKWLDYDKIDHNLLLRTRRPGDYLVIDQKGHRKKLKDYLIEEKVPVGERDTVPLLAKGSEILWVLGHRINAAYKISPQTKQVLEVQWRRACDGGENKSIDIGR